VPDASVRKTAGMIWAVHTQIVAVGPVTVNPVYPSSERNGHPLDVAENVKLNGLQLNEVRGIFRDVCPADSQVTLPPAGLQSVSVNTEAVSPTDPAHCMV
jgi:hypothetical protein